MQDNRGIKVSGGDFLGEYRQRKSPASFPTFLSVDAARD
jgi:hypothetical protein